MADQETRDALHRIEARQISHGEDLAVLKAERDTRRWHFGMIWGAFVVTWGGFVTWLGGHR